ncbi:hypothetical protein Bca4012_084577 [Brassica carinata]
MWKNKEAITPLHKKLYQVTNRIQQEGMNRLYSVVFNLVDARFYDYFATAGGNRINMYNCLEDRPVSLLQSYTDEHNEEQFRTVSWARGVDGKPFVAAGGERGIIRVINVNDKMVHKTLVGHEGPVKEIKTHPMKPQLVLSGSLDGSIRLWNIETGICILIFPGIGDDRSAVLSVDFHPHDMHLFVSCGVFTPIKIWSMKEFWTYVDMSFTWKDDPSIFPTRVVQFPVFTAPVNTNHVDCNRWFGDNILSKNNVNEILLWQPQLKENSPGEGALNVLLTYPIPDCCHPFLKFSCDLSMNFVSIGNDKGKIYVWDLKSFPPVLVAVLSHTKSKSVIRQTAMSVRGNTILATSEDGALWRWDVKRV